MMKKIVVIVMVFVWFLTGYEYGFTQDPHRYNPDQKEEAEPEQEKKPTRRSKYRYRRNDRREDERKSSDKEQEDSSTKKAGSNGKRAIEGHYCIGIKGGLTLTNLSSADFNIESGVDGGVAFANEVYFYDLFALEIDFAYKVTSFNSGDNYYKIEYFSIPLFIKYYFSRHFLDPEILEIWAGVGLEFRFKTGEKGFGYDTIAQEENTNMLFAIGFRNPVYKDILLTLDFRFYLGLTPTFKTRWDEKGYLREFDVHIGVCLNVF